ncbi:MAG: sugar lactone lactonase YvrE [Oceanospirillaceae bacterium]|jgi:sugar lactone lactonase YvrE
MHIFDSCACELGEGPLWHPLNQKLYWFDILAKKLFCKGLNDAQTQQWQFDVYVSAAGWIDENQLLIASATALFKFNLHTHEQQFICALEADNPITRSNDGRADPWGGFWIGTMGIKAEPKAGAIYRYYRGELRQLKSQITITNAICFSPDKKYAYYADTADQVIYRQSLAIDSGWLLGEAQIFIDLRTQNLNPDGAVIDAQGNMWVAQWGAARVAKYASNGEFLQEVNVPTAQTTCPAFGGQNFERLFVTSAKAGLSSEQLIQQPAGQTFYIDVDCRGVAEPRVLVR